MASLALRSKIATTCRTACLAVAEDHALRQPTVRNIHVMPKDKDFGLQRCARDPPDARLSLLGPGTATAARSLPPARRRRSGSSCVTTLSSSEARMSSKRER
jgi:hypothetical protein